MWWLRSPSGRTYRLHARSTRGCTRVFAERANRKADLLSAVSTLTPEDVVRHTVRGRYGRGRIDGRPVPGYVEEDGVRAERGTETYAQATLTIDNWRWAGVPFVLRSGIPYLAVYCRRLKPDLRIVSRITHGRNLEAIHRAGADFVLSYTTLGVGAVMSLMRGYPPVLLGEGVELFSLPVPSALAGRPLRESASARERDSASWPFNMATS